MTYTFLLLEYIYFFQYGEKGSGTRTRSGEAQDFYRIRDDCVTNGTLYEDTEFPAIDSSLFFSQRPDRYYEWKRPGVSTKFYILRTYTYTSIECCLLLISENNIYIYILGLPKNSDPSNISNDNWQRKIRDQFLKNCIQPLHKTYPHPLPFWDRLGVILQSEIRNPIFIASLSIASTIKLFEQMFRIF